MNDPVWRGAYAGCTIVACFFGCLAIDHYKWGLSWHDAVVDAGVLAIVFALSLIILSGIMLLAAVVVGITTKILDRMDPEGEPDWWHPKDKP